VLGCLTVLSCFISRLSEKGLPLYRLLKKHERFSWTTEAQEALDKLKASLTHASILTPPQDSEPLYLYMAATTQVVSAVIVVERTEEGLLTVKIRQPSHEFTFGVGMTFVSYSLVLTPVV
jgi:hypothetical protein